MRDRIRDVVYVRGPSENPLTQPESVRSIRDKVYSHFGGLVA